MTWQRYRLKVLRSSVGSIQTALWHHCIIIFFFLCVCFFFIFSSTIGGFFNLSYHLFSYPFCPKTNFIFHKNHFFGDFLKKKKKEREKTICSCRSRQILGYICRPIKSSQLTPHVQVRLTFLPCIIQIFLFKQISCLQSVVYEYIPLFYGLFFFHYVWFGSFELSSFENVIEPEFDVIFAICAVFMAVVVYW